MILILKKKSDGTEGRVFARTLTIMGGSIQFDGSDGTEKQIMLYDTFHDCWDWLGDSYSQVSLDTWKD